MDDVTGRVGRVRRGPHQGMYLHVTRDDSGGGWHVWLTLRHPGTGPSDGWDVWADGEAQVREWLGPELDVEWIE